MSFLNLTPAQLTAVGLFTPDWWRALLPEPCRIWFDAVLPHLGPVEAGDDRLGALFELCMNSWAISEVENALAAYPPERCGPLRRSRQHLLRERRRLAAELRLVWS